MNILQEIADSRNQDINRIKEAIIKLRSLTPRLQSINSRPPLSRLLNHADQNQIIAEIKPASPSKGVILPKAKESETKQKDVLIPTLPESELKDICAAMYRGNAIAISVLTEPRKFLGSFGNLLLVHQNTPLEMALLVKDFIIDPCQVELGKLCGASNGLVIAALDIFPKIIDAMQQFEMEPLIEVHNETELHRIKKVIHPDQQFVLGINNRNLTNLSIDLQTTEKLVPIARQLFGNTIPIITESGVETRTEMTRLNQTGISGALIGSSIMQSKDISGKILELQGKSPIFCKICGITALNIAPQLNNPMISAVGTVVEVPTSKRSISLEKAKEIFRAVPKRLNTTVVTKDHLTNELAEIMNIVQPRLFQYHGQNRNEFLSGISPYNLPKMIVAVNYRESNLFQTQKEIETLPTNIFAILLDSSEGNGQKLDPIAMKRFIDQNPSRKFIVAGGISPKNVKDVILTIQPFGIDASSQLETNGTKDMDKIHEFCQNIANAIQMSQTIA